MVEKIENEECKSGEKEEPKKAFERLRASECDWV